jgi:uncharacterized protein YkwD
MIKTDFWRIFPALLLIFATIQPLWAGTATDEAAALGWSAQQIAKANTAQNADYLTEEEKDVIFLTNLVRLDGALFANTFLLQNRTNDPSNYYVSSLYSTLPSIKNLSMLAPNKCCFSLAESHANDMGQTGYVGHTSSDGTSFYTRMSHCSDKYVGENCSYGKNSAIGIVLQLLIDEDVPSLGHRENILNREFNSVGVAIRPHTRYGYNCVMDFSGEKFATKSSYSTATTTVTHSSSYSSSAENSSSTSNSGNYTTKRWPQRFYDHSGRYHLSFVAAGYSYDCMNNRHQVEASLLDFRVGLVGLSLIDAEMCVLPYRTSVAYKPSVAVYLPVGRLFAFVPYVAANIDVTGLGPYFKKDFEYTRSTDFYAGIMAGVGFELSAVKDVPMRIQLEYRYPLVRADWQTDLAPSLCVGIKFYLGKAFIQE